MKLNIVFLPFYLTFQFSFSFAYMHDTGASLHYLI